MSPADRPKSPAIISISVSCRSPARYRRGSHSHRFGGRLPRAWREQVAPVVGGNGRRRFDLVRSEHPRECHPGLRLGVAKFTSLARLSNVVKLSDEDAAWLFPRVPHDALAHTPLSAETSAVVLTAAGAGATVWTTEGEYTVSPVRATVADTVGADDSFMSGLLAGIVIRGTTVNEAADLGARCAATTVSRRGANPPTLADIGEVLTPQP